MFNVPMFLLTGVPIPEPPSVPKRAPEAARHVSAAERPTHVHTNGVPSNDMSCLCREDD